jgi:hypothetical protein
MNIRFSRFSSLGVSAMLVATCGFVAAQTAPVSYQLVGANASLIHSLDSKNASQGEAVSAKLTSNVKSASTTELPKGTILIGKVESVQSSNTGPSKLSVVFDEAKLPDGKAVPVKATLIGAYPPNSGDYYEDTGAQGSLMAGLPKTIASDQTIDQQPGTLDHISLTSSVQSDASGVFSSKDHAISLKKGTVLQLGISEQATTAPGA